MRGDHGGFFSGRTGLGMPPEAGNGSSKLIIASGIRLVRCKVNEIKCFNKYIIPTRNSISYVFLASYPVKGD